MDLRIADVHKFAIRLVERPAFSWQLKKVVKQGVSISVLEAAVIHLYTLGWVDTKESVYGVCNAALFLSDWDVIDTISPYLKIFTTAINKLKSVLIVMCATGIHSRTHPFFERT